MAESSLAQKFQSAYGGSRRIGAMGKPAQTEQQQAFGKSTTVFSQKRPGRRAELSAWYEEQDIESLNHPVYEAKRMIGDTATVCHIDYSPTAAMTPRWQAYGMAYGVRFIVTLWKEDILFLNCVKGLSIGKADYTPLEKLDIIVKRYDARRGLSGAMGVFHQHKAVFVGEEVPATRKFQPGKPAPRKTWAESPFKSFK